MQKYLLLLVGLFIAFIGRSQNVEELIKQADLLEKQMKETESYAKFKEVVKNQPQHLYALIHCSELASRIGRIQTTKEKQVDFYKAAKIYAERALRVNPKDSDANMVMAVAFGRLSLMQSGKEKIAFVKEIKNFAEKAVAINPKNFKALHVLGKWHYEVSNLNTVEKTALKMFYGGLPKASFDSSLFYYQKAAALSPSFVLNYLEMAKVFYKLKKKEKAVEFLKHTIKLPDATSEDVLIKSEAKELLVKWS